MELLALVVGLGVIFWIWCQVVDMMGLKGREPSPDMPTRVLKIVVGIIILVYLVLIVFGALPLPFRFR